MYKILIVEDDAGIAEIHRHYIERIPGFTVSGIALSRAEAEIHLEANPPNLVLLDVFLVDGSGLDLLHEIRTREIAVDVMLLTAATEAATLQQAMRYGVIDYILKPVVFNRLEASLGNYRQYLAKLNQADSLKQSEVDRLMAMPDTSTPASTGRNLPKGIDPVTLEKIRALFQQREALSAEEAGNAIGSSRTTARRYLEYLVSCDELSPEVAYGSVGRPERIYQKLPSAAS